MEIYTLINPETGNTYKEDNLKKRHKFNIGDLVEQENGVRLFVAAQVRDCDGSLGYSLTIDLDEYNYHMEQCKPGFSTTDGTVLGVPEYCLKLIRKA